MHTGIILQARMGSSRYPEKVMKKILGRPVIDLQIERLKNVKNVDNIILATTENPRDDILCDLADQLKIKYFRGSENDVLNRFSAAARFYNLDIIVRLNADCPLIDHRVVDKVIKKYKDLQPKYDYVSNILMPSYPIGMHTEVFSRSALDRADEQSIDLLEREHVTPYIYRRPEEFNLLNVSNEVDLSDYRLTIDYECDFIVVRNIYENLYHKNKDFQFMEVVNYLKKNPEIKKINQAIQKKSIL
jgi:spore coat polysaccharide biosynthesis protein SpsF